MDPDNAVKPFLIFILGVHLTAVFKNLLTDVFHLLNKPDIAQIAGADYATLVFYIIMGFEFIQFVIFLVSIICVKKIQGKPSSSLLIACMICILLDILLMIRTIYEVNFGEVENQFQSLLSSKDLDVYAKEKVEKAMNRLSRWCIMKMLFDILSGPFIYLYKAKSRASQQDVHCEEGDVSAPASNEVPSTCTHPQYPVQPEGNVSATEPTLNAPQSTVIHPQHPV